MINLPSHIHPFLFRKLLSLEIFLHIVACCIFKGRSITRAFLLGSLYMVLLCHQIVCVNHKGWLVITLNLYSEESKEKEKHTSRSLIIMLHKIIRQFRKQLVGNCPSCIKIILILMSEFIVRMFVGRPHYYFSLNDSSAFQFALKIVIYS